MEPLVSVICITRNHERFCIESLDSVLNQTYKNIEWIILDAASTDGTVELIDNWLVENNVHAVFLKEKELKSLPINLNKALTYTHGEYVQFLSLDDLLLPKKINHQLNLIQIEKCDLVFSNTIVIDEQGIQTKLFRPVDFFESLNLDNCQIEIKKSCFCLIQSCLIPMNTIKIVGNFDEKLNVEDWDWLIRFWNGKKHLRAFLDKEVNVKYRVSSQSLWQNKNYTLFKSYFKIIKKHNITYKSVWIYKLNFFKSKDFSLSTKINILIFLIFYFRRISLLFYYINGSEKLFRIIFKIERKLLGSFWNFSILNNK